MATLVNETIASSLSGGFISRDEAEDFDDDAIESRITDDDAEPDERDVIGKCAFNSIITVFSSYVQSGNF